MNVSSEVLVHEIKRLSAAIYRRLIAWLLYLVKHPVKIIVFIIKAYLLLMLFAFFLAFSFGSFAQEAPPPACTEGGQWIPELQGCGIVKPEQACKVTNVRGPTTSGPYTQVDRPTVSSYNNYISSFSYGDPSVTPTCPGTAQFGNYTSDLEFTCSDPGSFVVPFEITRHNTLKVRQLPQWAQQCDPMTTTSTSTNAFSVPITARITVILSDDVECEAPYPLEGQAGSNTYCYYVPQEPCDCSELNGEGSYTYQSFLASPDAYSQENPPQCLSVRDSADPSIPSCDCQILATRWFSQIANVNGVEMVRWQPLPGLNGGESGVFTGAACGEEESTTPPAEKENCVTMKNGQKLCVAKKAEKCITLDGVQQCEAGCGTINGEFMCAESDQPGAPDPDEPDVEPDDEVEDPDKTTEQMTKQDYKDVNKGIETRLDLLAQLMERQTGQTTVGGAANGSKIDATNRMLGSIDGKLSELIAQGEGGEDGGDDSNPQPDYSTDALEEFVNPNDWEQRNFGTVLQASVERMQQAPVFTAVESFFDVSITGTCPTWQTNVSLFGASLDINIDQFCSPEMTNIWLIIRAVLLLVFSYYAFREAIL
ncbi:hypothetical protein HRH59_08475 [Rheinheimera sp. YQF-2]|uniref:Uncharacterized protein n=1 Tax=Rheinheimera lutimaris TaxID=2740584 RepID=A0A7Y5AR92_9GAMM|nr:hypothetical protein [Rheinheimera lutimaris]NRQ42609.1 hypothetical protein [Rheinheimera lutimaris]